MVWPQHQESFPTLHSGFVVKPGEELKALGLPIGATGTIAIYTGSGEMTHVIRKVVLRLESIMNYVVPN